MALLHQSVRGMLHHQLSFQMTGDMMCWQKCIYDGVEDRCVIMEGPCDDFATLHRKLCIRTFCSTTERSNMMAK
eukprot:1969012-Pyramimonas_sp.AAC.1